MPILLAPIDQEMKIVRIALDDRTKKHFENLGITIGTPVIVLSSVSSGIILMVKDGRLALDKDIAAKIFVA